MSDAKPTLSQEVFAQPKLDKKSHRTLGLKIFDIGLYPILTNFVVFGVSVAATYLTMHGDKTGGKIGKWFYERGNVFKREAMNLGMGEKQADAAKMITFSFLDGSVMAPFIKLLEDRREKIARWLDNRLGTTPADDSAYEAEPKQSWGSVLGGRVAALAVVLPTAIMLGKIGTKDGKWLWNTTKENPGFNSLNDHLFSNPGRELGEYINTQPQLAKHFGKVNIPVLSSVAIFEAFYTSVCTTALYVSSRFFASFNIKKPAAAKQVAHHDIKEIKPDVVPVTAAVEPAIVEKHHTHSIKPREAKLVASPAAFTERTSSEAEIAHGRG
ncbi:MAG: hypothetical protein SFT92_00170 [Rickettsiales bacterium]|nr:hypothetical protein [Rickettsiales bacterium]